MLFVPLPLVLKRHLPWRQKVGLVLVFSMGLFVIIAALLTKIFNLTDVWNPVYMLWYIRESSVAVFVSNLPMIWPLMREWFPCLRTLSTPATYPNSSEDANGDGEPVVTSTIRTVRACTSRSTPTNDGTSNTADRHSRTAASTIGKDG